MSYKTKHLIPAAMLAMTLSSSSCEKKTETKEQNLTEQGLLDQSPMTEADKYGSMVELRQVDIPIYTQYGKLVENCAVLTRGQNPNLFNDYDVEQVSVQPVRFNGNKEAVYARVGKYGEILNAEGRWIGLVTDEKNRAVPLSVSNVAQYRADFKRREAEKMISRRNMRQEIFAEKYADVKNDTLSGDTVLIPNDSIGRKDSTVVREMKENYHFIDSLSVERE